jgi:hypothetical protein
LQHEKIADETPKQKSEGRKHQKINCCNMHKVLQHLLKKICNIKKNPATTLGCLMQHGVGEKLKPLAVRRCLCKLPAAALPTMNATCTYRKKSDARSIRGGGVN